MTKEEKEKAILNLKVLREDYWDDDEYGNENKEYEDTMLALDIAIEFLEQKPILDNIRTEIEQLRLHKAQFITSDNKICIDSQEVLDIIDKYR